MSIMLMVVEADVIGLSASLQRTTVPFKLMLVELIANVDIRGISSPEILEKVNLVELIILSLGGGVESLEFLETIISSSIPCSLITMMLHLMNCIDLAALHVSSSGSPTLHTRASLIGDNINIPVCKNLVH